RKIAARFTPLHPGEEEERAIRKDLQSFLPLERFTEISALDYTDGVRMTFANGDVVHFRPSGNADEMRFYAFADTQERADFLAQQGMAEPDGILRRMEHAITG